MYIKKDKLTKFSAGYLLFSAAYFPWVICWMLTSSYYKDIIHPYGIINLWKYIGGAFLIIKIFTDRISNYMILFLKILIIILGAIVSIGNENASFIFYSMILLVAAYNLDVKWIIKKTMGCQIGTLLLTTVSAFIGIIPNDHNISNAGGFVRYREGLGYTYTTFAPNFLLSIVIEWFYLYHGKSRKKLLMQAAILMIINVFLYKKTGTRTSLILVSIIIFVKIVNYFGGLRIIKGKTIIQNIFIVMAIASIALSAFYTSSISWMAAFNNALSQRIRFAHEGLIKWGISSFGTSVIWNNQATDYNYIDSSYVNILICYGVVVFLVVIIGFTITTRYACKINNNELTLALIFWAIRAFIDPQLYLIWFNPFMFYSGAAVLMQFQTRKEKIGKKNVINYMRIQ